jgi:hypothetical protein
VIITAAFTVSAILLLLFDFSYDIYNGVYNSLLHQMAWDLKSFMITIFWILIFFCQTVTGLWGTCKILQTRRITSRFEITPVILSLLICLPLLMVIPLAPVFLVVLDIILTRMRRRNEKKFAECCGRHDDCILTETDLLIDNHREYSAMTKGWRELSCWQASNNHLNVMMESFPQLLILIIITSTLASFDPLPFLLTILSCSCQLLCRYLYRKRDTVGFRGKVSLFVRIFLETGSRLLPLILVLTHYNHLVNSRTLTGITESVNSYNFTSTTAIMKKIDGGVYINVSETNNISATSWHNFKTYESTTDAIYTIVRDWIIFMIIVLGFHVMLVCLTICYHSRKSPNRYGQKSVVRHAALQTLSSLLVPTPSVARS